MTDTRPIADVDEATFARQVLDASHERAVVVDFWAAWCGPCRQLSPLLEKVAARYAGDVDVVKVDVDANQGLARTYGVQGIPAVKAFRGGRLVSEFTGLQPEAAIDRFFAALAPTEADRLAAEAATATDAAARERLLREALGSDADHPGACLALAELLGADDRTAEAVGLLERHPGDARAQQLLGRLRLSQGGDATDLDGLRAEAAAGDADARLRLGRALAATGDHEAALVELLAAVADPVTRDDARAAVLEVFAALGPSDPLVATWRPRLAAALF